MRQYLDRGRQALFSATAKDTYILFTGNIISAFLGFVFIFLVARVLNREDFGVFSAALNLVVILTSLSDLGITSGLVNFIAKADSENDEETSLKYQKAGIVIKISVVLVLSLIVILFAPFISSKLLASSDSVISIWVAVIAVALSVPMYFPFILQAKKKFMQSMVVDNVYYLFRLIGLLFFIFFGTLGLYNSFSTALWGFVVSLVFSFFFLGFKFLKAKPTKEIYLNLIKFSGWIGVNRIISSISGRLDIQMLAVLTTASTTALYSIPSRLSSLLIILTSSFSAVLSPRFASMGDKDKERIYLVKAFFGTLPIVGASLVWVLVAEPFMQIVFPNYMDSVPVFRALTIAMIPFILTAPSVSAIIYAMKKNVYIGAFSFFQITAIFLLNYYFIPKYGALGPTFTFGIINTTLAIYTWVIVIHYYWFKK
ncbi:MAG: oligosaccharide flippase family protein [bacterium]|nr:MAG: oligosaccharide flippase family protein [bacterium]